MSTKTYRGDSVAVAKVVNLTPVGPIVAGQIFTVWCNTKPASYTAIAGDVPSSVVTGLANAIITAQATIPEFTEFTPTQNGTTLVLTAVTPGVPFEVTATCSGNIVVTENTAGGPAVNEVHKIRLIGTYTGGTFAITYNFGAGNVATSPIAYNASAATVQAALVALTGVGTGQVVVTGGAGPSNPWYATWTGTLGGQAIAVGTIDGSSLTGGATITIAEQQLGNGLSDEFQQVDVSPACNPNDSASLAATYTLTLDGNTTSALRVDATAAQIQTALAALPNVGSGNVECFGDIVSSAAYRNYGAFVHFKGALAGTNVSTLTVSGYTGTYSAPTITPIQDGGATSADDFQYALYNETSGGIYMVYNGQTTGPITNNNSGFAGAAAAAQAALQALSTIGSGNVTVYCQFNRDGFNTGGWLVRFTGALANTRALPIGNLGGNPFLTFSRPQVGQANTNEIQTIALAATGGTFTLTAGAQTTSAIAWNASTGTLQTRIQTDLSTTFTAVTVTGSGTVAAPWVVTVTNPANEAIALMTWNAGSLTGGSGAITELTAGHAGVNEVQVITEVAGISGGTFLLGFGGLPTEALAWNATNAQVQAALRALSSINTVTVSGSAGGPWTVTWSGAQASTHEPLLFADGSLLTGATTNLIPVTTATWSSGPLHYDDPTNWSPAGIPGSLDGVHFDGGSTDCLYGFDQISPFTWATSPNQGTWTGKSALQNGQVVFVTSSNTLPSGLSAGTSYYLVNVNRDAKTFQLATSLGGAPVSVTTTGTGTHTVGARLASIECSMRWSGSLGLPRENSSGYCEYRSRYLHVGLATIAQTGLQTVTIGTDGGQGSPKIQVDNDIDQASWIVLQSGDSSDQDARAVVLKGTNPSNTLTVLNGDVGTALFPNETAVLGATAPAPALMQRGGTLELGQGTTITGPVTRTGGTLISDGATINGACAI